MLARQSSTLDRNIIEVGSREDSYGEKRSVARSFTTDQPVTVSGYDKAKRLFDIVFAAILLLSLSPLMVTIALLVAWTSPGPIIYTQRRLTQGGRVFRMLKFRTMRVDAEILTGPMWARVSDPRVTLIGKILRPFRLDELPQLLNVLRGEMSLIGPRPERPELAHELEAEYPSFRRRLEVRGGLSGLAQVSSGYAANLESYGEKLNYDILYVENRSMALDLRIAFKTIFVILTRHGAR